MAVAETVMAEKKETKVEMYIGERVTWMSGMPSRVINGTSFDKTQLYSYVTSICIESAFRFPRLNINST
jgi:hypothetical protein